MASAEGSKRAQSNLDAFITHSRPPPEPVSQSQEIRDRGSTFFATIFRARSPQEAQWCIKHLTNVLHGEKPASHEVAAWRCMVVKKGATGLGGPEDFEMLTGFEDDGEQWGGSRVLKVMQKLAVIDAVVIVSRYYGGIMLGPARFTHIETCAHEVCHAFKRKEELADTIATLSTLDDLLDQLRSDLGNLTAAKEAEDSPSTRHRRQDYSAWTEADLPKARRLITAREHSISAVKVQVAKEKQKQSASSATETSDKS